MFKNFIGYNIVANYHNRKKPSWLSSAIKIAIAVLVATLLWIAPQDFFGIPDLTITQQRVIAIFAFGALMWLMEAISAWTTSVLLIVLLLLTVSDSGLWFAMNSNGTQELGTLVSYKTLLATFADPIIMLFLGGFILAIATAKTGIDVTLARAMLKPFGKRSEIVLLGFILVTAIFSMFVSNTATAAMMLTFLAPVLKSLPVDGKGRIALAMAIPIGANIGGIGTPIGTPPNAIALRYLNDPAGLNMNIGFGEWVAVMVPYVLVVLVISWVVLLKLFPFKQKTIELQIEGEAKKDWHTTVVYITFAVTVLMWMADKYTGVNANVVAMIPVAVFCATGIIKRQDLEEINWSVLWMVAGGFALGEAMNHSGLMTAMVNAIPFTSWSPLFIIIGSGLICIVLSTFISNTATATLLVPILAAVSAGMGNALDPVGGVRTLLVGLAISASLAMALPISTPPNAMAHGTGLIQQSQMIKVGVIMGVIGMAIGYLYLIAIGTLNIW